jgi:molecular chaperone DnaK
MDKTIIGIDLGTSTSEITVLRNGRPELLQDAQGDRIIPSVVQLQPDGQLVVGTIAKSGAVTFVDRTVQEVKRAMGTDQVFTLGEKIFRPEEISAIILRHLKDAAESRFGLGSVQDVVISVPARFENPAREATKRAAELAGLNVLRLINEPTAAALSYGLDHLEDEQKVLVFDFGGGTLDVTILEIFEGMLDVKTSVGDDRMGGKDVDALLERYYERHYFTQNGKMLPESSLRDRQVLKQFAEENKKRLSVSASATMDVPYLLEGRLAGLTMLVSEFEVLLAPMLARAMKLVDEALQRAQLTYNDIDVILPVGGSSRIPAFRRELERRWGRKLQEYDNPDEAVARGAAIAAGIEAREFSEDGIMVLDNAPHRLGVRVLDNDFSEIIPKDAKLPAIQFSDYETIHDGQESIEVKIFEAVNDSRFCSDHRLIGEMPLNNIPRAPAGQPLRIEFRYTLDGMLDASAWCLLAPEIKVDGQFSVVGRANPVEMEAARLNLDDLWRGSEDAKRCLPLLEQAKQKQQDMPTHATRLQEAGNGLRSALAAGDKPEIERRLDVLTDLLFELS